MGIILGRMTLNTFQGPVFNRPDPFLSQLHRSSIWVRHICAVREVNNTTAEDPARRYHIDPLDFLAADQWAEKKSLDIHGFYHSHPDHPAIPSEHDRKLAWGGYLYLIVSIIKAGPKEMRAWVYEPEDKQFNEVTFKAKAQARRKQSP